MNDGPTDFGSGYLFESQKGISDRRAARGLPPHEEFGQGRSFNNGASSRGGGSFVGAVLFGLGQFVLFMLPILWEIVKIVLTGIGQMIGWLLSSVADPVPIPSGSRNGSAATIR